MRLTRENAFHSCGDRRDRDIVLDVQSAIEEVWRKGRFGQRLRYDQPCDPPLPAEEQAWADERLSALLAAKSPPPRKKRRKE